MLFNLLPIQQKKAIHKEYNSRRSVLIVHFLNLIGLIVLLLLVPSFFLINRKQSESREIISNLEIETPELKNIAELELLAGKTTEKLKLLSESHPFSPLSIWENIVKNKTSGIQIKSFSFIDNGKETNATVNGIANSREALTNFAHSLELETQFKNVNLPVSSLTRDKDLEFSISFLVSQENQVVEKK